MMQSWALNPHTCAGCGMTGNAYTLPYSLGLPSWAYYLQTVGDPLCSMPRPASPTPGSPAAPRPTAAYAVRDPPSPARQGK